MARTKKAGQKLPTTTVSDNAPLHVDAPAVATKEVSEFRLITLAAVLITIGTGGFYLLPGMIKEGAEGLRLVNAYYCTIMTLTTVGYGDVCPGKLAPESRLFLITFIYVSLGTFCGPVMTFASRWKRHIPGGVPTALSMTFGVGALIFMIMEEHSQSEAIYASIILGTTIGFGDLTPTSDLGKILVASYCVVAIPVLGISLEPVMGVMIRLCSVHRSDYHKST